MGGHEVRANTGTRKSGRCTLSRCESPFLLSSRVCLRRRRALCVEGEEGEAFTHVSSERLGLPSMLLTGRGHEASLALKHGPPPVSIPPCKPCAHTAGGPGFLLDGAWVTWDASAPSPPMPAAGPSLESARSLRGLGPKPPLGRKRGARALLADKG